MIMSTTKDIIEAIVPDEDKMMYKLSNKSEIDKKYEKEFWVCCIKKQMFSKPIRNIEPQQVFIGLNNIKELFNFFKNEHDHVDIIVHKKSKKDGRKLKIEINYGTYNYYNGYYDRLFVFDNKKECINFYKLRLNEDIEIMKKTMKERIKKVKSDLKKWE